MINNLAVALWLPLNLSMVSIIEQEVARSIVRVEDRFHFGADLQVDDRNVIFYVLSGEVAVAGQPVRAGQIAWSDPVPHTTSSVITLATGEGDRSSVIMIYSGQPIGEPVVMGGPFVMNTYAEITQAFKDFRSGEFGDIPRQARLDYR